MGLLTDPSGGQGKFTKILLKYYTKLCILLYLVGVIWFCLLAHPPMNASTYFSENALLPGLVKSQFFEEKSALRYYEELKSVSKDHGNSIPYSWMESKFRQIGLDTFTHNFSINSPLHSKKKYGGKNVYGILRAARASSTEGLVLSVPYRSQMSVHPNTLPSIALMLAFAEYANKEKYWAKDIIFLVTEHEQLGIQAWLEAYHGVTCGDTDTLAHGDLKGRAGAIQAAINMELHSIKIGHIDIKIEGLNGQLPNLDLFNLAAKMCVKEGVYYTFKNKSPGYHRDPVQEWWYYFKNLLLMVATQATGIPNGNHGLFHRFGIQALTLEGFEQAKARGSTRVGLVSIGRILEGTFRSLNNLLERFHQSFFFYLLPCTDRYISIGLYMPSVCLIIGALLVKACAKWCEMQETSTNISTKSKDDNVKPKDPIAYPKIIILFLLTHAYGVFLMNAPKYMSHIAETLKWDVDNTMAIAFPILWNLPLAVPFFIAGLRRSPKNMTILYIFALLELGTVLICVSMNNFSLGLICAVLSVPFALLINPTDHGFINIVKMFQWLLVHPYVIVVMITTVSTYQLFPNLPIVDVLRKGYTAFNQALLFSIVDSSIYGNWLFSVITAIFIPNWLCFYYVTFSSSKKATVVSKKIKTN